MGEQRLASTGGAVDTQRSNASLVLPAFENLHSPKAQRRNPSRPPANDWLPEPCAGVQSERLQACSSGTLSRFNRRLAVIAGPLAAVELTLAACGSGCACQAKLPPENSSSTFQTTDSDTLQAENASQEALFPERHAKISVPLMAMLTDMFEKRNDYNAGSVLHAMPVHTG